MATSLANARTIEWVNSADGTQYESRIYAEGTSETFNIGDLVVYDASENGVVEVAQGDGGVFGDSTNDELADVTVHLGIALTAATGTAGSAIEVLIPRASDRFACVLYATDNTTITAPDVDNIGELCDFIKGNTANGLAVGVLESSGAGSGLWARIVDLDRQDTEFRGGQIGSEPTYSAGDRVIVQFQVGVLDSSGYQA